MLNKHVLTGRVHLAPGRCLIGSPSYLPFANPALLMAASQARDNFHLKGSLGSPQSLLFPKTEISVTQVMQEQTM